MRMIGYLNNPDSDKRIKELGFGENVIENKKIVKKIQKILDSTFIDEWLAVNFYSLIKAEYVWNGLIVALGFMFTSLVFSFYPIFILLMLTLIIFLIALKHPAIATIIGMIINLPAIGYQSAVFAWLSLLGIALTLFKTNRWRVISFLLIIIFSPFAPFPFNSMTFLVFTLIILFSLYLGSKESILISLPSVFMIMFLSSLWLTPNGLGVPVNLNLYQPGEQLLMPTEHVVNINSLISMLIRGISDIFSMRTITSLNTILSTVFRNIGILLILDSAIIQLLIWGVVIFLIAYIPGVIRRSRWKQTIASLFILIIPLSNLYIAQTYDVKFNYSMFVFAGIAVAIIFILELLNIEVSRERLLFLRKRAKKFGSIGLIDLEEAAPNVKSLNDVGNYEDVKEELKRSILLPMEHRDVSFAYGIKPPSGILLFGPPGTGKTFIMTALAKELDMGFFYVKSSNLLSSSYGQTEKNIIQLFETARKNTPCILFFDELDAIGKRRDKFTSDETSARILSVLLQELDGFKSEQKAIVIGATNMPHMLDPALLRPGRFDKLIYMPLPDLNGRKEILKIYLKKMRLSSDVDINRLAYLTDGFSGADIANLTREASRLTAEHAVEKKHIIPVSMNDFEEVLKYIKPSVSTEELEKYELFRKLYDRTLFKESAREEETEKITYKDIVGLDNVKKLLRESIELPLKHPELLKRYDVNPVKGILLFGPPGCGKTMIAKASANEFNVPLFSFSSADLVKHGVGLAVNEIKKIFNNAKSRAPSIIFIDEIDHIVQNNIIGRDVLSQLLVELDGVREMKKVIIVASSNRPWRIESALLRPGRFDRIIYVHPPDTNARRQLFINKLEQVKAKINYDKLAELTKGYSGADISSICQEVKLHLIRGMLGTGPKVKITTEFIESIIKRTPPTINKDILNHYKQFAHENERR